MYISLSIYYDGYHHAKDRDRCRVTGECIDVSLVWWFGGLVVWWLAWCVCGGSDANDDRSIDLDHSITPVHAQPHLELLILELIHSSLDQYYSLAIYPLD